MINDGKLYMTPREMQHLVFIEKNGRVMARQTAKYMDIPVSYSRHLLDYLSERDYVSKIGRDTYQILSKGIDALISEYMNTLSSLDKKINNNLNDKRIIVEEIRHLEARKNDLAVSVSIHGNTG